MAYCFIPFINPREVTRFIELADSRDLRNEEFLVLYLSERAFSARRVHLRQVRPFLVSPIEGETDVCRALCKPQ